MQNSSQKLRTLIIDDEPLARQAVLSSLKHFPNIDILGECGDGVEAIECIQKHSPDFVFLDIQMPECTGIEVIEALGEENMPHVIFVTAYDEYAIQAFEKRAIDYLLKPFTHERFCQSISHIETIFENKQQENWQEKMMNLVGDYKEQQEYIQRVIIRTSSKIYFVNVGDIHRIQSAGNYVEIFTADGTHLLRETMAKIETMLDPKHFMRIHRTAIVNMDHIKEIHPDGEDYLVLMDDNKTLPMSKTYKQRFNREIGDYI